VFKQIGCHRLSPELGFKVFHGKYEERYRWLPVDLFLCGEASTSFVLNVTVEKPNKFFLSFDLTI
jgi:hypothetical protein